MNGWKNYETWNVSLWIGNDEALYEAARRFKRAESPYKEFAQTLAGQSTPDGVRWDDSALDITALDSMMRDL